MATFPNLEKPIIRSMLSRHFDDAAFYWAQRCWKVHAPNVYADEIAALDRKIHANLWGLQIAGLPGWQIALSEINTIADPGNCFVATNIALSRPNPLDNLHDVISLIRDDESALKSLKAALAWSDSAIITDLLKHFSQSSDITLQEIALSALVMRRQPEDYFYPALDSALHSDGALQSRALKAIGELGLHAYAPQLRELCQEESDNPWASWSLVLLGDRTAALQHLHNLALMDQHADEYPILQLVIRASDFSVSTEIINQLNRQDRVRSAIIACGLLGATSSMEWLLEKMETPELSQLAFMSFSQVTGLPFEDSRFYEKLPPEGIDEDLLEDTQLPWPNVSAIGEWWRLNANRFNHNRRYMAGAPLFLGEDLNTDMLHSLLNSGTQTLRKAAALELMLYKHHTFLANPSSRML